MNIRFAGPICLLIGVIFLVCSFQHPLGSLSMLGSGAVPVIISLALICIGIASWKVHDIKFHDIEIKQIFVISCAIILFCIFSYWLNLIAGFIAMSVMYFYGLRNST